MRLDDLAAHRQAKARSGDIAGAACVDQSLEGFEDALDRLFRHPGAVIDDGDIHGRARGDRAVRIDRRLSRHDAQLDVAPVRPELDRVVQEVDQDLFQSVLVGHDRRHAVRNPDVDLVAIGA